MVNLTLPQLPPPGSKWEYGPNGSYLVPLNGDSPSNNDLVVETVSDEMSSPDSVGSMEELFGDGFKSPEYSYEGEYNYEEAFSTVDGALKRTRSDQLSMTNEVTTNSMSNSEQIFNRCNSLEHEETNGITLAMGNHRTSNSNVNLQGVSGSDIGRSSSPATYEIPKQAISRKFSYQEPPVNSHYMKMNSGVDNSGYQSTTTRPSSVGPSSPYPANNQAMPSSDSPMVSTSPPGESNGMISYVGYPSARNMAPVNNGSSVSMSSLGTSNTMNHNGYPSAHSMVPINNGPMASASSHDMSNTTSYDGFFSVNNIAPVNNNSMAPTILSNTMHNMNFGDYHHSPNGGSGLPGSFGSLSPEELGLLDGVDFGSLEKADKKVHLQGLAKAYMSPSMANIGYSSTYTQESPVLASGENIAGSPTPSTPVRKTKGRAAPVSTPTKRRKISQSPSGSGKSPASPPSIPNAAPSTPPKGRKTSQSSSGSSKSPASPTSISNGTLSYIQDMVNYTPRYGVDRYGSPAHTDPRFELFRKLGTILGNKTDTAVPATGMWKFKYIPDEVRTKIWQLSVSGGRTFNISFDKSATWDQIQSKCSKQEGVLAHDQKLPGAILANKESYRVTMMLMKTIKPQFMTRSITFNPSMDIILFNSLGVLNSCADYDLSQWARFGIQKLGIDATFFKTLADVEAATTKDWPDSDRLRAATHIHAEGHLNTVAIIASRLRSSLKDIFVFGQTMDKARGCAGTLGMVIIDLKAIQEDVLLKIEDGVLVENNWMLPRIIPMERSSDGN